MTREILKPVFRYRLFRKFYHVYYLVHATRLICIEVISDWMWLQEVMGKTDAEIYSGLGVDEVTEFKREVLQRGWPLKREINFDTDLFGPKTFIIAAEPVFSKTGDTLGLNYVAMDITDEV